ncbi:MAG: ParB/RepB/Spo0J family partition protein [Phycisphaeraceae bacterium]|nr:ParB/RepB/Spo0J family partition protein [Phycisphaeraceae bacterium]
MAETKSRPPRLGKGLSSLMGRAVEVALPAKELSAATKPGDAPGVSAITGTNHLVAQQPPAVDRRDGLVDLPIESIQPNPHQPRQHFDEGSLQQLAASIRSAGVMQPVIVRPVRGVTQEGAERYELVAGERRWRAAQVVGLSFLPAIIRQLDDLQLSEWAIIENLQREDLNPIDRAEAFQRLIQQFNLTHEDIAARVGLDRSSISNNLRLLNLTKEVCGLVRAGKLSAGQAKALVGVSNPQQQAGLAHRAVKQEWSVRQLEQAVRMLSGATTPDPPSGDDKNKTNRLSAHLADLEQQIGRQLSTKARIRPGRKKGTGSLTIEFYSIDQFDSLLSKLGIETE